MMWAAVLGLAMATSMGCAEFDGDIPEPGEGAEVVSFPEKFVQDGFEQVIVQEATPHNPNNVEEPDLDSPCSCDSQACLEDWVSENFGCDICVGFVCDGAPAGHACNGCVEDPVSQIPDLRNAP